MAKIPSFKTYSAFTDRVDSQAWEAMIKNPFGKVAFRDFNNDGKIDRISTFGYGGLHLQLQEPSEGRDSFVRYSNAEEIKKGRDMNDVPHNAKPTTQLVIIEVADLDQDGDFDIVVANRAPEKNGTIIGSKQFLIEYFILENLTVNKKTAK